MNEHTLKVLEYDKVIQIAASYAASEAGQRLTKTSRPAVDALSAALLLKETAEFTGLLQRGEKPPFHGIPDVEHAAAGLSVSNSMLSPAELLDMAALLSAGRRVRNFFQHFEDTGSAPILCGYAAGIRPLIEIENSIFGAIDDKTGGVKDSASPLLRKIRKQLVRMREEVLRRMSGILQEAGFQKVIQEPVITLRDDRYVLPLKPNFRQSISGVVHGQSGSRATLFVEPLDILEQNNRLAELRMEEQEEVERILRELTSHLASERDVLYDTIRTLAFLDAIYARSLFGVECHGSVPGLSPDRSIRLRAARHPLLVHKCKTPGAEACIMANDIILAGKDHALIVSGPNAGGKTVVLKTAGLLCVLAQSGFPIPAAEGSEVPCFSSVYADIGDDQSLEQDQSTFSSHVSRIAEILREADSNSLVLLDELGSGTEPGEGAGLGAAVLEKLIERGTLTIVTTHHHALKLFGARTSGAVNAAMEFDPETLQPTYRLIPGRPGRSYGLDMAARMGIPAEVIQKARSMISEEGISLDELLKQIEQDSLLLKKERLLLDEKLGEALQERTEAMTVLQKARDDAREAKLKAQAEAREVLSELRQKLRELNRMTASDRSAVTSARSEVDALSRRLEFVEKPESRKVPLRTPNFSIGETVRIGRLNKTGIVLAVRGGMLELQAGSKKIKVSADEAVPVDSKGGAPQSLPGTGWGAEFQEEETAVSRLNIIGLRVAEALPEVESFIDRAGLHHISVVTVIHGLGTGALKTAVSEFLRGHPLVELIRQGEPAEGGAGVTVVHLKR